MASQRETKQKFERIAKALTLKPSLGKNTLVSTTYIDDEMRCVTTEGDWHTQADLSEAMGGLGSAPTPGVLGRAALGSCLAMGYKLWAAKLNVPIQALEVTIEAEGDDAGMFGTNDVPPGYTEVRYHVRIKSTAPQEVVLDMLNTSDKHGPWLDIFTRSIRCVREVEIVPYKDS